MSTHEAEAVDAGLGHEVGVSVAGATLARDAPMVRTGHFVSACSPRARPRGPREEKVVATTSVPRGWDLGSGPQLSGQHFLVTGATSGLGLATARALRSRGAHVTITARDGAKGEAVVASGAATDVLALDLADLSSVHRAAERVTEPYDVVILNAGVMWTPYELTADGFELQMGTNHLGHFAFAGLIRDRIARRLVTVSSLYHRFGTFGDGSTEEIRRRCRGLAPYDARRAYGDSKLANLLFTEELERRRRTAGAGFVAVAAHPGWTNTNLFDAAAAGGIVGRAASVVTRVLAQRAARGALPTLCAATWPGLSGGEYFGPRGPGELRGAPTLVRAGTKAHDERLAQNLWRVSEELTGVRWGPFDSTT